MATSGSILGNPVRRKEDPGILRGQTRYFDDLPVEDVRRFESELHDFFRTRKADLLAAIRDTGQLPEEGELKQAVDDFKSTFQPSGDVDDTTISALEGEALGEPESDKTLATE